MSISTSTPAAKVQEILPQLFEATLTPGKPYIQFQLTNKIAALLPLEQVQESMIVEAAEVSLLPSMHESVIGMMSSRNHVFCVIDLAQLFMLDTTLMSSRQYQIIVLRVSTSKNLPENSLNRNTLLGIAVHNLQGIIRLTEEKLQTPEGEIPESLNPYLRGAVITDERQMLILEPQAIAEAPCLYQ